MKYRYLIFFSLLLLASSCRREGKPAQVSGPEGTAPIELRVGAASGAFTRGMYAEPGLLSRSMTIAGDCDACIIVERTSMDVPAMTRAFTPVTEDNVSELYVSVFKDVNDAYAGNFVYQNATFGKDEDGVFRDINDELFWPATPVDYSFYISNVESSDGRCLTLDGTEDVVWGEAAASYKETCSGTLEHIYASIGTLTMAAPEGSEVRLVSASLSATVSGVWDMYQSSLEGVEPQQKINLVEGANNILLFEGDHTLNVEYELTDASITGLKQTVKTSGKIRINRGQVNNITVNAASSFRHELSEGGGNAKLRINRSTNMLVYLSTYFTPSTGEGEFLLDTRLLTHEDTVEFSASPEGIVTIAPNPVLGPEYWDINAVGVGTATVTMKYKDLEDTFTVTVEDYETSVETRNPWIELECTEDCENVSPAGAKLTFVVNYGFEYCVHYASGSISDWYAYGDGPIDYERFYSDFGLSMIPYLKDENPKGFFRTEGTDGDFDVIVSPNMDTDQTHTATVGIKLTVNGQSVTAEVPVSQDADAVAGTGYRNLLVTIQVDGKNSIVEGPSAHTVDYVVSSTAEVRHTMLSGSVTDWQRQSVEAETSVIRLSGDFITLNTASNQFELSENRTDGAREGVLQVTATFQGMTATGDLAIRQTLSEFDHIDYRNVSITSMTNDNPHFSPKSWFVLLSFSGTYQQREVYTGGADAWKDKSFLNQTPNRMQKVVGGVATDLTSDDWVSTYRYGSGATAMYGIRLKENYSGTARSITLRAYMKYADTRGSLEKLTSEGYYDFTVTQDGVTLSNFVWRLYSPSNTDAHLKGELLLYNDCVFELESFDCEHGHVVYNTTNTNLKNIYNNVTYMFTDLRITFDRSIEKKSIGDVPNTDVPNNGGMALAPAASVYAGKRNITWNNLMTTLPPNGVKFAGYQCPRYSFGQINKYPKYPKKLEESASAWGLLLTVRMSVKCGSKTYADGGGLTNFVLVNKECLKIADIAYNLSSCSLTLDVDTKLSSFGQYDPMEGFPTFVLTSGNNAAVNCWATQQAKYKIGLYDNANACVSSSDWTGYETVKFYNGWSHDMSMDEIAPEAIRLDTNAPEAVIQSGSPCFTVSMESHGFEYGMVDIRASVPQWDSPAKDKILKIKK